MRNSSSIFAALLLTGASLCAAPVSFIAQLGNFEAPPTGSLGTGWAFVTMDVVANTLAIDASFSGLTGLTTAAHIHCCIASPGNAGVATQTPSLIPLLGGGLLNWASADNTRQDGSCLAHCLQEWYSISIGMP